MHNPNLERFIKAQDQYYQTALHEIRKGRKVTHWMWYIFPQLSGLGYSQTAKFYGIQSIQEAKEYLSHFVLGPRLIEISRELLKIKETNASSIMGSPDDLKLRSSMTLFASLPGADIVFTELLQKFYGGTMDHKTLELLQNHEI